MLSVRVMFVFKPTKHCQIITLHLNARTMVYDACDQWRREGDLEVELMSIDEGYDGGEMVRNLHLHELCFPGRSMKRKRKMLMSRRHCQHIQSISSLFLLRL